MNNKNYEIEPINTNTTNTTNNTNNLQFKICKI